MMIVEQVSQMSDITGSFLQIQMWRVREKVSPQVQSACETAKVNSNGDSVSNWTELKQWYGQTYKERLRHRQIKPSYTQLKQLKDYLFDLRLKTTQLRKTNPWAESELLVVTSKLNCNKAADPMCLVFELFKPEVAGEDMFQPLYTRTVEVRWISIMTGECSIWWLWDLW